MIDTVVLSVPRNKATVLNMSAYGVESWDLQARTKAYDKYVKNPSKREADSGLYFPRLTGYKRKNGKLEWESTIRIEFSAPKLLYKNNLDELTDSQFPAVVEALRDRLNRMGVVIAAKDLASADVIAVHYSKNVELRNGYTAQYVISELGKINLNKRFDLTRARYMNDGQSICAYTIAHSLIIYDKIADLTKDKRRAIDREQTPYQLSMFESLRDTHEILRLEVRLSQKRKLNALYKQLGFAENPRFEDVFSAKKGKAVLMHYWDTMIAGNSLLVFAHSTTSKDLLKQILLVQKKAKGKTAIFLTGLLLLAREGNGLRELRSILSKRMNMRSWYRLIVELKDITAELNKLKPREWYAQVEKQLREYKRFRLSELGIHKKEQISSVKNSKV